jgi:hypothetical protein
MAAIFHRVKVSASLSDVFSELIEQDVVRHWRGFDRTVKLRLVAVESFSSVEWRCDEGPAEWLGTHIRFDLACLGSETVVHLRHLHWRAPSNFMAECTTIWGKILLSLKARLEVPEPEDLYV